MQQEKTAWTWGGRVAVLLAGLLCAALGPLQSTIWNGTHTPAWVLSLPWTQPALAWQKASGAISGYYFFGRFFFLVYIGCLIGLSSVAKVLWAGEELGKSRWFRLLGLGLWVALVGDLVAYWGGSWWGKDVRFVGFWLTEVPALLFVLVVMGILGFSLRAIPGLRFVGWSLVGIGPLALLMTSALRYMPHGPMMAVSLGCAIFVWGVGRAYVKAPISSRHRVSSSLASTSLEAKEV